MTVQCLKQEGKESKGLKLYKKPNHLSKPNRRPDDQGIQRLHLCPGLTRKPLPYLSPVLPDPIGIIPLNARVVGGEGEHDCAIQDTCEGGDSYMVDPVVHVRELQGHSQCTCQAWAVSAHSSKQAQMTACTAG
jgi:hypothetical protein